MNLLEIDKYLLTCEKSKDRADRAIQTLKEIGWDVVTVDGEITTPYSIGVAKSLIKTLSNAKLPVLLLEDDIAICDVVPTDIDIPDDADAIYLGTSQFGILRGNTVMGGVVASAYNSNLYRVFNMLGLHAVIYNSHKYISHVIEVLAEFINNPGLINIDYGCDNPIAKLHSKYNIYAVKKPMFYQNDGHSESATLTPIDPILC